MPASLVSVIVPCYKYAHYLTECLDSLIHQTYKEIEIIVVSDASPDNTAEIVAKFPTVKLITHKINKGLGASRNTGIKAAKGEYIVCLDADDKFAPNTIEELMRFANPDTMVIPGLQEFGNSHNLHTAQPPFTKESLLQSNRIHCASLYPKRYWEMVNGYDESELMRAGYEDWDFWLRIIIAGCKAVQLSGPLFFYRIHDESMIHTTTHFKDKELRNYIRGKHGVYSETNLQPNPHPRIVSGVCEFCGPQGVGRGCGHYDAKTLNYQSPK